MVHVEWPLQDVLNMHGGGGGSGSAEKKHLSVDPRGCMETLAGG